MSATYLESLSRPRPAKRTTLFQNLPASSTIRRFHREDLRQVLSRTLDRTDVLEGHTGCVNALSWARDGTLLLSSGDDTTIRLWQLDSSQFTRDYPLSCSATINTGHRANIFNAKMLPYSSRIVTAAGDAQIRVFDVNTALASATPDKEASIYSSEQLRIATLHCHQDSVKKIVTEESPDLFLSVSEDGTVRQHDLRIHHSCRSGSCSTPLVDAGHGLFSIALSPLTPYQFVVAGEGLYGYLYDRRHLRRTIESSWGMLPNAGKGLITCVRKFGRPPQPTRNGRLTTREHITSTRMSGSNGHEVLLSYSNDGVYLFSTRDEPDMSSNFQSSNIDNRNNPPNSETSGDNTAIHEARHNGPGTSPTSNSDLLRSPVRQDSQPAIPIIMPRHRYTGARNIATIKDVNFLGPNDDWIVSGSDDGNFFIWNKVNEGLHGLYEGDSSVVNVIEGHPRFPLVAVSGIDNTIKMFSPVNSTSSFSRMADAHQIMENNKRPGRMMRANLSAFRILAGIQNDTEGEVEVRPIECTHQ